MSERTPSRIHTLPTRLANQIAAGEVIERPASVAKELVENGLDAGAARIEVDVEHGGTRLVRVRDDGVGIHRDDLALALDRHATSKIASLEDLENVLSLGFRGEALPSIASVSRLELSSRSAGQETGCKLTAHGREDREPPVPVAHPVGTTVAVRDLFYNTPARRKFLRTEKTEFRHIEDVLKRAALSRFDTAFVLRHNGRDVYALPAADDDRGHARRLSRLCGAAFWEHALKVEFGATGLRLGGWIASGSYTRAAADLQHFFVNGRGVRDNVVRHAIRQAYHDLIPDGRQPAFVLYLQLDAPQVDVNVHPTKHEVRFRDARSVHDFIARSLHKALTAAATLTGLEEQGAAGERTAPVLQWTSDEEPQVQVAERGAHPGSDAQLSGYYALRGPAQGIAGRARAEEVRAACGADRPLGEALLQVGERYLVAGNTTNLVLVDARRACQRIALERLKESLAAGRIVSRPLLVPVSVSVGERRAEHIDAATPLLESMGFDLRRVSPESVSCRKIPALLAGASPAALVQTLADVLGEKNPSSGSDTRNSNESPERTSATGEAILRAVVEGCDLLATWSWERGAMNALLRELEGLGEPGHGRDSAPVWIRLGAEEMAALLGRNRG